VVQTIHFPIAYRRWEKKEMTMIYVKRVQSAAVGRGRVAPTEPIVRVAENGQVTLNTLASKALEGYDYALLGQDSDDPEREATIIEIKGIKTPAKVPFKVAGVQFNSLDELAKIRRWGSKGSAKNVALSLAGNLRAVGYDYKSSGGQNFVATVDGSAVQFTLPMGALPPKPKVTRVRKANNSVNAGVAVATAENEGLDELETF
jgi:hypothetical protein